MRKELQSCTVSAAIIYRDFDLLTFFLATIMSHFIAPCANVSYVAKLARSSSFMSCTFSISTRGAFMSNGSHLLVCAVLGTVAVTLMHVCRLMEEYHNYASRRSRTMDTVKLTVCVSVCLSVCLFQL